MSYNPNLLRANADAFHRRTRRQSRLIASLLVALFLAIAAIAFFATAHLFQP